MLIIAMPKSASTSLMITLGKTHNLKAQQDFSLKTNAIPNITNVIHTVHSDIRELVPENIIQFNQDGIIYKQHIFPTNNNLKLLKNTKKVILVRNPKDVLFAYLRGARKQHNGLPKGYLIESLTKKKVLEKARNDGFFEDICFFKDQWTNKSKASNTLIIQYKEYINETKLVLNKIELFFGLPVTTESIIPVKARYSRNEGLKPLLKKNIIKVLEYFRLKNISKKILKKNT